MTIQALPLSYRRPDQAGPLGIVSDGVLYLFDPADPRTETGLAAPSPADACLLEEEETTDFDKLTLRLRDVRSTMAFLLSNRNSPGEEDIPLIRQFDRIDCAALSRRNADSWSFDPMTAKRGRLSGIVARRLGPDGKAHGKPTQVHAAWVDAWGMYDVLKSVPPGFERVQALAGAYLLCMHTLGIQPGFSSSWTGHAALREHLSKWNGREDIDKNPIEIARLSPESYELLVEHRAKWPLWARQPTFDRPVEIYQHDRNWSFVSSAREVPVGDPLPTREYQPGCHGFYRLDADMPASFHADWPGVFVDEDGRYPHQVRGVVAWNPQIELAMKLGCHLRIHSGYYWPKAKKHDLFRIWQERLWRARRECEQLKASSTGVEHAIASCATKMIKLVGVASIGKLLQGQSRYLIDIETAIEEGKHIVEIEETRSLEATGRVVVEEERQNALYQPAWWSQIIARQSERVQSALYSYTHGEALGTYVDCLYCTSPIPELSGDRLKVGGFRLASSSTIDFPPDKVLTAKGLASLHANMKGAQ